MRGQKHPYFSPLHFSSRPPPPSPESAVAASRPRLMVKIMVTIDSSGNRGLPILRHPTEVVAGAPPSRAAARAAGNRRHQERGQRPASRRCHSARGRRHPERRQRHQERGRRPASRRCHSERGQRQQERGRRPANRRNASSQDPRSPPTSRLPRTIRPSPFILSLPTSGRHLSRPR